MKRKDNSIRRQKDGQRYFSFGTLKRKGWTAKLVWLLLEKPDWIRTNPNEETRRSYIFFLASRVEEAMRKEAFRNEMQG